MIHERLVRQHVLTHIHTDYVVQYGNPRDLVIESVATPVGRDMPFEIGYYYGDDKPKPIVNISPMVGCPAACQFCELGSSRFEKALTAAEMYEQVILMLRLAGKAVDTDRQHKVNLAKSGEPLLNPCLVEGLRLIGTLGFSFKVSTVFPRGDAAWNMFARLAEFAGEYQEPVQVQVSLISTDEDYRTRQAGAIAAPLCDIRRAAELWRDRCPPPRGRTVNLSLILNEDTPASAAALTKTLPPDLVHVRLRDCLATTNATAHGLQTVSETRYRDIADDFRQHGYHVSLAGRPTSTERRFGLVSNVTLARYKAMTR